MGADLPAEPETRTYRVAAPSWQGREENIWNVGVARAIGFT